MVAILSKFLPLRFRGQYWFMDHNFSYFAMDAYFIRNDFVLLCQYYSFMCAKDLIEETHAFLLRLDTRGVKWLIFVPSFKKYSQTPNEFNVWKIWNAYTRDKTCDSESKTINSPSNLPFKIH